MDGLRTDWGLKVLEHMKGVVPMMVTIGEIATVVGFLSLVFVKVITFCTTSQLCGVKNVNEATKVVAFVFRER